MTVPLAGCSQDPPPRTLDEQRIKSRADFREYFGDPLPGGGTVTEFLSRRITQERLRPTDDLIELLVTADGELPEAVEELAQVFHGTVAEDLGLAVLTAGQPFVEMLDEFRELFGERRLREPDGVFEPRLRPAAFLAIDLGMQPPQVIRRFDAREIPGQVELARQ